MGTKIKITGTVYATSGWMNYKVKFGNVERRVIWRNHNTPYIKLNGKFARVYFNPFDADEREIQCKIEL